MKTELKCLRFITNMVKKMVLRLIGIQMEGHGMNDITNLEKKMALGLSGILTNR